MADTLKLEIVTPEATVYSEDVHMVTLPAVEGQIGIFPHHVPLLTRIVPGEIMVRKNGHDDFLAVGGGLVEITSGRVAIVTDMGVAALADLQDIGLRPGSLGRALDLPGLGCGGKGRGHQARHVGREPTGVRGLLVPAETRRGTSCPPTTSGTRG